MENEVEVVAAPAVKVKRKLTNDDLTKYEPMVEKFIRDSCAKNWNESKTGGEGAFLGTSGYGLDDIRQHLRAEICIALQNYNPDYRTKEGRSVKESTFVYQHLTFRVGQMMKRLTKKRQGYGVRHNPFDLVIQSGVEEASVLDLDLVLALDKTQEVKEKAMSQVEQFLARKKVSF